VKIKKNEMGRECGTHRRQETCIQSFWWGILRERDHLEDPALDVTIIIQ
jgi:hypothetical protein